MGSLFIYCGMQNEGNFLSETPGVIFYEDLSRHPAEIETIAREIGAMKSDLSLEEYQKTLAQTGLVETPYGHFKDFEYFWEIKLPAGSTGRYSITAAFATFTDDLAYSSISVGVPKEKIFAIQHNPESTLQIKE